MFRIGHGYDVHRFKKGRDLILGGEKIEYGSGLDGHSDADVLLHAVCDSILGALALGDIGKLYPPNDDRFLGISSILLLEDTARRMKDMGYAVGNLDCTVIAQKPKLSGYTDRMRENISRTLGCDVSSVNVKATTEEGLGFTGRLEGISAHAVCILEKT